MYRDRPQFWVSTNEEYKNKNKRHDLLTKIADPFGIEKSEAEKKIKNLQSQFSRERKREKDSQKTSSGTDEIYQSKWFAYGRLLFLTVKNKPRKTLDTEVSNNVFIYSLK